jgi:hypothetical protein
MPDPSVPLTTTFRRTEAALVIRGRVLLPVDALFVAGLLDAVSAAVLRTAGLADDDARTALVALWSPVGR